MVRKRVELTQGRLRELLRYSPDTGEFSWQNGHTGPARWRGRSPGGIGKDGYLIITVDKRKYPAHRLAWFYVHNEWPAEDIDHINHDRSDNRIENLRSVSRGDNLRNMKLHPRNKSGFNGVSWSERDQGWYAYIGVNNKCLPLGFHKKKENAIKARQAANERYGFHENHGT